MVDTSLLTNALQRVELSEYEKRLKEELAKKHAGREDGEDSDESAIAEEAMSVDGSVGSAHHRPESADAGGLAEH